ncbi:MAG: S26 family signal peptidase [Methanoregula sp.]|nr:S26 family signal peptidase [Methanoregula sp.]
MVEKDGKRDIRALIRQFRTSEHGAVPLVRDALWLIAVVGTVALALYLICGTWPAVVTIESKSMDPHMKIGDLVVVVQKDRYGAFQTWLEGRTSGYTKYEECGDVIIYKPNGLTNVHPIIHRAIQYVDGSPVTEIKEQKLIGNYTPPHPGYITWGDNNPDPDQGQAYRNIGVVEPIKEDWIIGKALFAVPLVGYLPLNIWAVAIVVIIAMVLHELYLRSKENEATGTGRTKPKKTGKKQR